MMVFFCNGQNLRLKISEAIITDSFLRHLLLHHAMHHLLPKVLVESFLVNFALDEVYWRLN